MGELEVKGVGLVGETSDIRAYFDVRQLDNGSTPRLQVVVLKHIDGSVVALQVVVGNDFDGADIHHALRHQELFNCHLENVGILDVERVVEWLVQGNLLVHPGAGHVLRETTMHVDDSARGALELQGVGDVDHYVTVGREVDAGNQLQADVGEGLHQVT